MTDLFKDDSPLRYPPRDLDPVQQSALDAVSLALDSAWLSYNRLFQVLREISSTHASGQISRRHIVAAFVDAWGFVDNVWRTHQTLLRTPRLKRTPQLEVDLRALNQVELLRHAVRHMDERLRESVEKQQPIWGYLSWLWTPERPLVGGTLFTLVPGSVKPGAFFFADPRGKRFSSPVGVITLAAFGHDVELSAVAARIEKIAHGMDHAVREAVSDLPRGWADFLAAAPITFTDFRVPE